MSFDPFLSYSSLKVTAWYACTHIFLFYTFLKNTDMVISLLEFKFNRNTEVNGQLQSNIIHVMMEKIKGSWEISREITWKNQCLGRFPRGSKV